MPAKMGDIMLLEYLRYSGKLTKLQLIQLGVPSDFLVRLVKRGVFVRETNPLTNDTLYYVSKDYVRRLAN